MTLRKKIKKRLPHLAHPFKYLPYGSTEKSGREPEEKGSRTE